MPAEHPTQVDAPAPEYWPVPQLSQLVDPDVPEYKPASHGVHEDAPNPEYWPAKQLAQLVALSTPS